MTEFNSHTTSKTVESECDSNPEEATTHLDHAYCLGNYSGQLQRRQTKIMCSMGPASRDVNMVQELLKHGMDIARVIMGRDTLQYHTETIENLRKAVKNYSEQIGRAHNLAIGVDLQGAEIRTGLLHAGLDTLVLQPGKSLKVTTEKYYFDKCTAQIIYVDYENLPKVIKESSEIYIKQGIISLVVTKIIGHTLDCYVKTGGILHGHDQINLPGTPIDLPHLSERDKIDLEFAVEQKVDIIFASFVRSAAGVAEIRQFMGQRGKDILVISKVENQQGLDNFQDILVASDGILIARGDIGVEIAMEKVFLAQKHQISMCNQAGKPAIVASQMMESMVRNSRPSRPEAADVTNAVLDGADVITLHNETAIGSYALKCLSTAGTICQEAETTIWRNQHFKDMMEIVRPPVEAIHAIATCAVQASMKCQASAILVATISANACQLISKYRPRCTIIGLSRTPAHCRQWNLYKGVFPVLYAGEKKENWIEDIDDMVQFGISVGKREGFIKARDALVVVTGWKQGLAFTNTMRIVYLPAFQQRIIF